MTYAEKLERFRAFVEKMGKDDVERRHPRLGRDYFSAVIVPGKVYDKVDVVTGGQQMGRYMVEVRTEIIYGIKGYGKVHKGHRYGTLDTIEEFDWSPYYAVRKENV